MRSKYRRAAETLPAVPVSRLVGHDGPVQRVIFTDDGKYALTGAHDRTVMLWNPLRLDPAFPPAPGTEAGREDEDQPFETLPRALPIQTYDDGFTHDISAIATDKKSEVLAAGSDKTLVVTDMLTKRVKRRFQGHSGRINAVCVSEGTETFLSASYDATVRIWDGRSASFEPIQILKEAKDSVTAVHVDQNEGNAVIRTGSVDGKIRSYDLRKGMMKCDDVGSEITDVCPTRDGQCVAVSCLDGTIRLVELDGGDLVNTYNSHAAGNFRLDCCLTSDDSTLLSGSEDGKVILYDIVKANPVQELIGHRKPTTIAANPNPANASVVISASFDGEVVVWANDDSCMGW